MEVKRITVFTPAEFRRWLKKHHTKEHKVAVVVHKKHTGKKAPTHRQMIEEAICFGWIDTTIKRIDHDTFVRHFSKRTEKSKWSDNTLSYAARLVKEGRMSPHGMHHYKLGKARPTHDHGIPKNPDMPHEIREALNKNPKAKAAFAQYPPSTTRTLYRWFLRAKGADTKAKRVKQIITSALAKQKHPLRPNTAANT
ncbi:MAG: YdeI/OmpD-associated family protein [Patescibacteria group bacterium]|nr:YdeI/OmpD-associated family protein [Patescibacteria group bacterium]